MLLLLLSVALRRLMVPRELLDLALRWVPAPVRRRFARAQRRPVVAGAPSSLDHLTSSARERRERAEPAAEIRAAQEIRGERSGGGLGAREAASEKPPEDPDDPPPPVAPSSLAENLLARRKKRR